VVTFQSEGTLRRRQFVCRKIYMMAVTGDETETGRLALSFTGKSKS